MLKHCLLPALLLLSSYLPAQELDWRKNYDLALLEARERNAPLFILFAGRPCTPAEMMYRRVLKGEDLRKAAADFVPLICHLQDTSEAYFKGWPAYLRQHFFTPAYIFADPQGHNLMPEFTIDTMHRMLKKSKVIELLGKARAKIGKVIERQVWRDQRADLRTAMNLLAAGQQKECGELLKDLAASNLVPLISRKAKLTLRRLQEMELSAATIEKLLEQEGDLSAAKKLQLQALDHAQRGDFANALELLNGKAKKTPTPLAQRLTSLLKDSMETGRIKITKICPDFPYGAYWQIGVTLRQYLPRVHQVTVQYYAQTETNRIFAGYQTFDWLDGQERLQLAAYLPLHCLASYPEKGEPLVIEDIKKVHFQVFAGSMLTASGSLPRGKPGNWWQDAKPEPLVFLENMDWTWEKDSFCEPIAQGLIHGSKQVYIKPAKPATQMAASIMAFNLDEEIVVASLRSDYKALLEVGQPIAGNAIIAAFHPKLTSAYTFLRLLAQLQDPRGIPFLGKLLKHPSSRSHAYALSLLACYRNTGLVDPKLIAPLLAEKNSQGIRQTAAELLGTLDRKEALPLLTGMLKGKALDEDTDATINTAICRLTAVDFGLDAKVRHAPLVALAKWQFKYGNEDTTTWAKTGIRHAGFDPETQLPAAAADKRWYIAAAALRLLARKPNPDNLPMLLELWRNEDKPETQQDAYLAMLAAANREFLTRLCRLGMAEKEFAKSALNALKDLAGNHTFLTNRGIQETLEHWEIWLEDNLDRLYRPEGEIRFRIKPDKAD